MGDTPATSATYQVDFQPLGKRVRVAAETTVLEAAREAGLGLASACGGRGTCGQCRVEIRSGVSPPAEDEQAMLRADDLAQGMRLACRARVRADVTVDVPATSLIAAQRLQLTGDLAELTLDPSIRAFQLDLPPPSLEDVRSDVERLVAGLPLDSDMAIEAGPTVVRQLTPLVRRCDWSLTAFLRGSELVGVAPAGSRPLGLAVDLGTTKIAAALVDLSDGQELATAGMLNPQIGYGEDVISRLAHARRHPDGAHALATMVQEALNDLLGELTAQAGIDRLQVADVCLVGNTAMVHLLLELPVRHLAVSPYVAATGAVVEVKARDLGLEMVPGAVVHVLPAIGGFVGGDHVAMILANHLDRVDHVTLGLDIGTNTEIVLADPDGALTSVSCASGPAFEGGHISDGMRAVEGAIEAIELTADGAKLVTVGDAPAIGLCGSGIIDGVAELRRWDIIDERGRFDRDHPRVRAGEQMPEFLLACAARNGSQRDLTITQEDVNEIQMAKGAIRAGLEVLLEATETAPETVEEVVIAGAFGSFLKLQSALVIGLLPPLPHASYRQVGNAALAGARWALVSQAARRRAREIAARAEYLAISTHAQFTRHFADGMGFPEPGKKGKEAAGS